MLVSQLNRLLLCKIFLHSNRCYAENTPLDSLYLTMYEQLITAMIFNTFRCTLSLLLRGFGYHSNRSSPRVNKICTPLFFKMISLKLTKNAKKINFKKQVIWELFYGHVDPHYYVMHTYTYARSHHFLEQNETEFWSSIVVTTRIRASIHLTYLLLFRRTV